MHTRYTNGHQRHSLSAFMLRQATFHRRRNSHPFNACLSLGNSCHAIFCLWSLLNFSSCRLRLFALDRAGPILELVLVEASPRSNPDLRRSDLGTFGPIAKPDCLLVAASNSRAEIFSSFAASIMRAEFRSRSRVDFPQCIKGGGVSVLGLRRFDRASNCWASFSRWRCASDSGASFF